MNLLILYHSGTGNTEFACEVAGIVIAKAGYEVKITTFKEARHMPLEDYDAFCFASPVYAWQPAKNVERFIKGMPSLPGKCSFILTTSAGAIGQTTALMARWLRKKGITVLGDYNLICPGAWPVGRRWTHDRDGLVPDAGSVNELAGFVEEMLSLITTYLRGGSVDLPRYRVMPSGLFWVSRSTRVPHTPSMEMGKKRVDKAACNQCGICERDCPVDAIELNPYPQFDKQCIACWRCINTCPKDCITTWLDSGRHFKGIPRKEELLEKAGLR